MSNSLIFQLKIKKSKLEKELNEYSIKITRLLNELAGLSCPYFESISDIEAEKIEQIGDELKKVQFEALEVQETLKKISKDLGED